MLKFSLRILFKLVLVTLGVLGAGVLALAWWAGSEIASPERRVLEDYHREFLSHPDAHGVGLTAFQLNDGTPCFLCVPQPDGKLGARGVRIRAQFAERGIVLTDPGETVGTLVLIHGRRGRKEDFLPIAERLCAVGFRCLLPDMPAHGDHPAKHAGYGTREAELPAQLLMEAAARFGFDPQPAGILGISMGGSVAVHAAARTDAPWRALVVIASFDSLAPVVEHQATKALGPWSGSVWAWMAGAVYQLRTGIALQDIQPASHAASLALPSLIAHGNADRVVPMAAGRRLFEALPAALDKKWIEIPAAGHDTVLITDFPIYFIIAEWMLRHVRETT